MSLPKPESFPRWLVGLLPALLLPVAANGASSPSSEVVYKMAGGKPLRLFVFQPNGRKPVPPLPVIVFFHGGGWVKGTPSQFFPQCERLAARNMVAISAEYRTQERGGNVPADCIEDAKSAIRWARTHAAELGIRPDLLAAGGGSAGGHLAACSAILGGYEADGEDAGVTSAPDALVLFNPVLDTTPQGYGANLLGDRAMEFSPAHHVRSGLPPTLVQHGTADRLVPFENAERFCRRMKEDGNRCELLSYDGQDHGFFNKGSGGDEMFRKTMDATEAFLESLGFLTKTTSDR